MNKPDITLEMYQNAIETLNQIHQEKLLLKKLHLQNSYQSHLYLPETFEELLLTIKKENHLLDREINLEKKKLATYLISPQINYQNAFNIINNLLSLPKNKLTICPQSNIHLHESWTTLISKIKQKETNIYLENYILDLIIKEKNAQQLIKIYKKRRIKKNIFKKILTYKRSK